MKKYEVLRIFLEQMQENTICLVGVRTGGYYSRGTKTRLAERTVFTSFLSVDFVFSISHQELYTSEQDWCASVSEKNWAGIDTVDHHAHIHSVVIEPPEVKFGYIHSIMASSISIAPPQNCYAARTWKMWAHLVRKVVGPPSLLLCSSSRESSSSRLNKLLTYITCAFQTLKFNQLEEKAKSNMSSPNTRRVEVLTCRPSMVTSSTCSPREKDMVCDLLNQLCSYMM